MSTVPRSSFSFLKHTEKYSVFFCFRRDDNEEVKTLSSLVWE